MNSSLVISDTLINKLLNPRATVKNLFSAGRNRGGKIKFIPAGRIKAKRLSHRE